MTTRFIRLNKINRDTLERTTTNTYNDTDEPGETANAAATTGEIETQPVEINVAAIRCFYARKDRRAGTRLTFTDGGGFAVIEDWDTVAALVDAGTPDLAA